MKKLIAGILVGLCLSAAGQSMELFDGTEASLRVIFDDKYNVNFTNLNDRTVSIEAGGGWAAADTVVSNAFVAADAILQASIDGTSSASNTAAIAINTSNIATNTADIAAVVATNAAQDVLIATKLSSNQPLDYYDTQMPSHPEVKPNAAVFTMFSNSGGFINTLCLTPAMTGEKAVLTQYKKGQVAPDDANNVGGSPQTRMTTSDSIIACSVAQLNPFAYSGATTNITLLSSSTWNTIIGRPPAGEYTGEGNYGNGTLSFLDEQVWRMSAIDDEIEFYATDDSEILFYKSNGSSTNVEVYVDVSGGYVLFDTITMKQTVAGAVRYNISAETKVKLINKMNLPCYTIAVDNDTIFAADPRRTYDSISYWRDVDYDGNRAQWIGPSEGANDFAWAESGERHFGSYHGGHSAETITLHVAGEELLVGDIVAEEFRYGASATFVSESTLTSDVQEYTCTTETTILPGADVVLCTIDGQASQTMGSMYMGMSIAAPRFTAIQSPIYRDLTTTSLNQNTYIGDVNEVSQLDPIRGDVIKTKFTGHTYRFGSHEGPYVQTRAADFKVYNNPVSGGTADSAGAVFAIIREYYD